MDGRLGRVRLVTIMLDYSGMEASSIGGGSGGKDPNGHNCSTPREGYQMRVDEPARYKGTNITVCNLQCQDFLIIVTQFLAPC